MMDFLTPEIIKVILFAAIGGFFVNVMNLYEDSQKLKNERTTKDGLYWFMFVIWPFSGGLLGYLYVDGGNTITSLLAFNIGISAPLILKAMFERLPSISLPTNAEE